jgi:hypothetical protein
LALTPQPDNLTDRLRRLEDRVDQIARGTLGHAVISTGGITIRDEGGLRVEDNEGQTTFFVGGFTGQFSRPDGTAQPVTVAYDDRGAARLAIWDDNPTAHTYRQYVAIWDYAGNIIFSDDAREGAGIGRPYIGGTVSAYRYTDWPGTQASDWDSLQRWTFNRQHPRIEAFVYATTDNADTLGEARIRDVTSNTVLGTVGVKFEKDGTALGPVDMPGNFGDICEVRLEAHRIAGTGNVRATLTYATGMQTF